MELNNLVRAAIFCALAVGMGFSLMLIPNIELITVIVFIAGLHLGIGWGILVGGTAVFIYSGLNPMGSGLAFPPLFIMQILCMSLAGAIGGMARPVFYKKEFLNLLTGGPWSMGLSIIIIYYVFTFITYSIFTGLG